MTARCEGRGCERQTGASRSYRRRAVFPGFERLARLWRRQTVSAAIALVALTMFDAPAAEAAPSRAYLVIDAATGAKLVRHNANKIMHPASLTKMMTLYLTFEAIAKGDLSLDDSLKTSAHAASMPPSKLGLVRGKRITVRDAVRSAAVFSANDAAVVLAEAVAGSEKAFAKLMTKRARSFGMRNTTFKNASGLTARGHLSTPADMAILARRLLHDFPANYIVFGRKKVTVHGHTRRATNRLLHMRKDVDGLKTGYTSAAGFNLAATAKRGETRVIAVLLGERSRGRRDRKVSDLLDLGLERMKTRPLAVAAAPRPSSRPTAPPMRTAASAPELTVVAAQARRSYGVATQIDLKAARRAMRADARRGPAMAAQPRPAPRPTSARRDRWSVQVGAYRDQALAARHLARIASMRAPHLGAAERRVESGRKDREIFRARFAGLDKRAAADACAWLARRRVDCMPVPPGGWGG